MNAFAKRAFRIALFITCILLAAFFFAVGCEALQLGPFIPTASSTVQPAHPAGLVMLLISALATYCAFRQAFD